jgi:hypothetical protein
MDNPEKQAILGTKDIGQRQTKQKTQHRNIKRSATTTKKQKTKT